MDLHQFSDWLSSTPFSQAIQVTSWAIPAIQTVHIIALAALFACALVLALRFAGRGFTVEPLSRIAARYGKAIWVLLLVLLVSGGLLIVAEPGRTITNPVFYLKMGMLAAVAVLTLWLSGVARRDAPPAPLQMIAAALTMVLWTAIMFAGRFIAYVESY